MNEKSTIDELTETPSEAWKNWWRPDPDPDVRAQLRKENMSWFERKYQAVYRSLADFEPQSTLVFSDDGQPDFEFAGARFYDGVIDKFVANQLQTYWKNPNRLSIAPPVPQNLDRQSGRFLFDLLTRLNTDIGVDYSVGRSSRHSFYMLVMGVALGRHLPELIATSQARNIFLLEPNLEGFYHSLELLDWAAIMQEMQDRDGDIFFYMGGSPQNWMDALRVQTRGTNVNSIDGTYVYSHYNNPLFSEFSKKFNQESNLLLTGLGFFYDEQIMLRNTHHNLSSSSSRAYKRGSPEMDRKIPAIIVGCGPSLDKNIQDIKRLEDKAVIFSCGSALGPLMDAGIRPDFQLELENIDVLRVLLYAAENHDLSGICLVASSTVERRIKDFFDEVVYYFRPALCPYPIFCNRDDGYLLHLDPTVVNVGLSFALEMGFREIYFFGADMGQKGVDTHHAKSSFHYSDKAKNETLQVFDIDVPANFGGKAKTSSGLFWALDTIQRAILYTQNSHRYYNCSDGTRIRGATPKLSRTLELPEPEKQRDEVYRDIVESFPELTLEAFDDLWRPEEMIDGLHDRFDQLTDLVETHNLVEDTDHLIAAAGLFYGTHPDVNQHFASLMIRGTMNQALLSLYYYLGRIVNDEACEPAEQAAREEFLKLIERMREIGVKHIRALDAGLELDEDYIKGSSDEDGLTDEQRESLTHPRGL